MTEPLFRDDAYETAFTARVVSAGDGVVVLDRTLFYPQGGGQPGDAGTLTLDDGRVANVVDTRHGADGAIEHHLAGDAPLPEPGSTVRGAIDWDRRYARMRMHTALHLLSVAIPAPVTGGSLSEAKGRLDFDLPESTLDRDTVTRALADLIAADHPVTTEWITDEELDARPELVKTLSVQPPRGSGRVRLVRIGDVDLQPCGGTHVASTREIGRVRVGKVESKGKQNRRKHLVIKTWPAGIRKIIRRAQKQLVGG